MNTPSTEPYITRTKITRTKITRGGIIAIIATTVALVGIGLTLGTMERNERLNTPWAAAQDHVRENGPAIRGLLDEAAQDDPAAMRVLETIPRQDLNIRCTAPGHDAQARSAISRTSQTCRLSL